MTEESTTTDRTDQRAEDWLAEWESYFDTLAQSGKLTAPPPQPVADD